MKKILINVLMALVVSLTVNAQTINNWRGPNRDGIFQETNLLKVWPENGPQILWTFEELGKGFTSPTRVDGKIYVTGLEGDMGFIYIFSEHGKLEKKIPYGEEISESSGYPGTRSTPTIADNLIYIATGHGKLVCLDLNTGKEKWSKNLFNDFDGTNIRWSLTENLIVDGDAIYVAPGGKKNNVIALNRHNGNLIWSSEGKNETSAYCSPLLINHNGRKIYVTMMEKNILGLDAGSGALLWSYPHENQYNIYPNTPIYFDNSIYFFSGYGKGGIKVNLNADGSKITLAWTNETLDPQMGGAVLLNGYVYASGHKNRKWFCLDWESGEIKHESKELDKGAVIAADNMLYAYTERGELALIEPLPGSFRVVSKTMITLGSEQHWAHPVIHNGILYVRHGKALMAFDIRKK